MNIDLNKFLTNEEMLILCLDYVIMDIKANGYSFVDACESQAGSYISAYCIDKLGFKEGENLTSAQIIKLNDERLSLLYDRVMTKEVEDGILEPSFNEDGSITYEQVR